MRAPLLYVALLSLLAFHAPARSAEPVQNPVATNLSSETVDPLIDPAPLTTDLPSPRRIQPDCPVSWCAAGLELSIEDLEGSSFVPVMDRGYGLLNANAAASRLVFTNKSYTRLMVLFSINGLNPLDGKPALRRSKGYIIPAQGTLSIDTTSLPGASWFSGKWPSQGYLNIGVYKESPYRPIPGTNDHEPPPGATTYLKDEKGGRYWVPPAGFPFRHDGRRLDPVASTYWKYTIQSPGTDLANRYLP